MSDVKLSVILPAKNEASSIAKILPLLKAKCPNCEIVVVDDGSIDGTAEVASAHGVRLVQHPYSMGNGAAVKSGARSAYGELLVFMDADGQHDPDDVPELLRKLDQGYDMVVGARGLADHAGAHRGIANLIFNRMASWMVNHRVDDLTSGFRAVRADKFRRFLYLLPNAFSYPTTITMSFFRAGFRVAYVPVRMPRRNGRSHIRPLRDGVRFLLIIIKIGTLYSPLKLFLPVSAAFFALGLGYYAYTYIASYRFTNMSALLFIASILTFLIGIVSEQISALMYRDSEFRRTDEPVSKK
jgi:glycosyltransferase involved in cell wall biosynthesis